MFIKHYAPNRCLCIKVDKSTMCNWSLGWGLQRCHNYKIAVSSVQRMEVIVKMLKKGRKSQGEGGMCTKNGSYCEKEKKCERRSEAFVKIHFFFFFGGGEGVSGWGGSGWMWMEKWSFCENSKKIFFFFWGGEASGWGSGWMWTEK